MVPDPQTVTYFDAVARDYGEVYVRVEADADLRAFIDVLPGRTQPVLDWGCGVGNTAAILVAEGYDVDAVDAAPQMARMAEGLGIDVRVADFSDIPARPSYGGIWANFSLMHCPRPAMLGLIARAAEALVPKGILHLGLEEGAGEDRCRDGILTTFATPCEIERTTSALGLETLAMRRGRGLKHSGAPLGYFIHLSRKPG